jgi:hypothetical protein
MIVTRGLGRPARGAIVAFGLGLAVAGGLPVDVTLLASRDQITVTTVTQVQEAVADTQTFWTINTAPYDVSDVTTVVTVDVLTRDDVDGMTVTQATATTYGTQDLETTT